MTDFNPATPHRGAEAIEAAIARGVDLDDRPLPLPQLELYRTVMELEAGRPRSGVQRTLRDRIVRIGCKHFSPAELDLQLREVDFPGLTAREREFFYGRDEE